MLKGSDGFSLSVIRSLVIIVLSLSAVRVLPPVEEGSVFQLSKRRSV